MIERRFFITMSERQTKKIRKEQIVHPQKKQRDKKKILFNSISAVIIIAFLGLASYAIANEIISGNKTSSSDNTTDTADTQNNESSVDTSTLGGYAEASGLTFDQMVEQYGLDTNVFSAEMPIQDAFNNFTLENIAKMQSMDIEEFKTQNGLPADIKTNVPNTELDTSVMLKVNGIQYTIDELRNYGLSEDITESTPWGEAQEAVSQAVAAKMSEESGDAQADNGETTATQEGE